VASHASALKAHRQSLKNREHNRQFRSRLRTALKNVRTAIDGKDKAAAKSALREVTSLIDKLASKGIKCELDLWGHDVPHDWPSWRAELAHHMPRFC